MRDPIGSFETIKENFIRYVQTAFRTNSKSIEDERYNLLNKDKVLYRMPWIEPLPDYLSSDKRIDDLNLIDLSNKLSESELQTFKGLVKTGLVADFLKLHSHQTEMLKEAIAGNNCIITSGTGSGKTESFLLPLFAQLTSELKTWKAPKEESPSLNTWWRDTRNGGVTEGKIIDANTFTLSNEVSQRSHETRPAAVRALILYPMNALVEDQMTRLRKALDSDDSREWFEKYANGNKIFFGRYNSSAPVSGSLFKINSDGQKEKNNNKITQLRRELLKIEDDSVKVDKYIVLENKDKEESKELKAFFPRLDGGEMRSRFDMQISPPDILITNYSMLSIMLMREIDSGIFEKTRSWLECEDLSEQERDKEKKNRVFHLIIDELHLYRGTQGSEVAYLLKLVLRQLGLHPDHEQLRILASSASLEPDDKKSLEFIKDFFGVDTDKKPFKIIQGINKSVDSFDNFEKKLPVVEFLKISHSFDLCNGNILKDEFVEICVEVSQKLSEKFSIRDEGEGIDRLLKLLVSPDFQLRERLYHACEVKKEDGIKYNAVCTLRADGDDSDNIIFAERIFDDISNQRELTLALRGLLILRSLIEEQKVIVDSIPDNCKLPRFRFHYFFRNIEGLWASVDKQDVSEEYLENSRQIGEIFPVSKIKSHRGNRVLELLYCDNCGTTMYGGSRLVNKTDNKFFFELLPISPNIEGIPEKTPAKLVEKRSYQEYAVFWPSGDEIYYPELVIPILNAKKYWRQTTINGAKQTEYQAEWIKASLNKNSGDLSNSHSKFNDDAVNWIKGYYFTISKEGSEKDIAYNPISDTGENIETHKALPNVCPNCGINHRKFNDDSKNRKTSSIRGFRTGFAKTTQTFAKELMYQLPDEKDKRKLVVFSDSREDAAQVANGIERNHHTDLQRELLVSIFNNKLVIKAKILDVLKNDEKDKINFYSINYRTEYEDVEILYDDSQYNGLNTRKIQMKEDAVRQLQNISSLLFPVKDIVLTHNDKELGPILKEFAKLGINPGGHDLKIQSRIIAQRNIPWFDLIDFDRSEWKIDADGGFKELINDESFVNLSSIFFGSLFYSLESSALGYLTIDPYNKNLLSCSNQIGLDKDVFLEVINAVVRILGDKYKHNRTESSESENYDSYIKFPTVIRNYIKAVAELHSLEELVLGDAVYNMMKDAKVIDRASGIIIDNLYVKAAVSTDSFWQSVRGNKIHLHKCGGIDTFSNKKLEDQSTGICDDIWVQNYLSYNALKQNREPIRLHCEELTGQTDNQFERQRHFRNIILTEEGYEKVKIIDLLSVTTTLEVGVDIGALQAVMLGNMPPQRFNYQQRVGRAGRRGQAYSVILTFCRGRSHDEFYFANPQKITGDPPPTPFLTMGQERIFKRLLAKEVLRNAYSTFDININNDEDKSSIHGEFGKINNWEQYKSQIEQWINENHSKVSEIVLSLLSFQLAERHEDYLNWIIGINEESSLMMRIDEIIKNTEISTIDISEKLAEGGVLPMFGMPTTVKNLYHGLNQKNELLSIDRPQAMAIYEFAPGSQKTKDKGIHQSIGFTSDLFVKRHYNRAVIENSKTEDGTPFSLSRYYSRCKSCGYFETYQEEKKVELENSGESISCPGCGEEGKDKFNQSIKLRSPIAYRTNFSLGKDSKDDSELLLSRPPIFAERNLDPDNNTDFKNILNTKAIISDHDVSWRINSNSDRFFRGKLAYTKNSFPFEPREIKLKNQWISSDINFDSEDDRYNLNVYPKEDSEEELIALASQKKTEVFRIAPSEIPKGLCLDQLKNDGGIRAGYYSLAFLLQRILADKLDVDPMEIEIADIPSKSVDDGTSRQIAEIILTDELPNGSGFVRRLYDEFEEVLEETLSPKNPDSYVFKLASDNHIYNCKDACYECLKIYRNMNYHSLLDWRLGISMMRVLADPDYSCGIDGRFEGHYELKGWLVDSKKLSEEFCKSFDDFVVSDFNGLPVINWGRNQKNVICIVHPFWDIDNLTDDYWLAEAINAVDHYLVQTGGKKSFFDTFNLHRRPGWCYEKLMKE